MTRLIRGGGDGGTAIVEFSLLLPIVLILIFGLLDVSRAVWQENTLAYAAREGTRYAIVHGSAGSPPVNPSSPTGIVSAVTGAAIGVPNITVTVSYPDGCLDRTCRVSVDATAPFVPLPSQYLLNGAFNITLRGGSMLVIQQ